MAKHGGAKRGKEGLLDVRAFVILLCACLCGLAVVVVPSLAVAIGFTLAVAAALSKIIT
jgi:hypothetical protein